MTGGNERTIIPDFTSILGSSDAINYIPGELELSRDVDLNTLDTPEVRWLISRIYTCANQHNTRYFYVMTDRVLRIFRRVEQGTSGNPCNGWLESSGPIFLERQYGLTANLALFYLHLLGGDQRNQYLRSTLWKESRRLFDLRRKSTYIDSFGPHNSD